ncbi:MAG: DUF4250 domain-containing protein [Acholeplasmatales bacterium]|nr:DUF4250 domain-containing protein [Acholeplasmatales bacterium]
MIKDPNILLSVINTKLRDNYDSLDFLVDDLDYDKDEIEDILGKNGYYYDQKLNQFIQK